MDKKLKERMLNTPDYYKYLTEDERYGRLVESRWHNLEHNKHHYIYQNVRKTLLDYDGDYRGY